MPLQGFTQGAQPVLGYNYGARQYGRVREGIRFVTTVSLAFGSAAWLILMLFPGQLIRLFNGEQELLEVGIISPVSYTHLFGQTLIMITHDENLALQADRIMSMEDGRIARDEVIRR